MAHKCNTTDKPWESKINGQDEGKITVDPESADGRFRGRHVGKNQDIEGLCFEVGGDRILFVMPANNPEFVYMGAIDTSGSFPEITGQRLSFSAVLAAKADTKASLLADDWTAEKPPTLAIEEEKDVRTKRT
jgi:hypothetical protein